MDQWKLALDIETIQWNDLLDRIDNLIYWIEAAPNHIQIDYGSIPSGLIDT